MNLENLTLPLSTHVDLHQELVQQASFLSRVLQANGVKCQAFSAESLKKFSSYDNALCERIVHMLTKYNQIIMDIQGSGVEFRDTVQSIWRIANKFDWLFRDDILQDITDTDVVEIYSPDHTQIYRNLNYFNYTSYSITDLIVFPWNELIEHGPEVTQEIGEIAQKVFMMGENSREKFKLTPYLAKERFSSKRFEALLTSKSMTPIRNRSTRVNEALLVVWDIKIINQVDHILEPIV